MNVKSRSVSRCLFGIKRVRRDRDEGQGPREEREAKAGGCVSSPDDDGPSDVSSLDSLLLGVDDVRRRVLGNVGDRTSTLDDNRHLVTWRAGDDKPSGQTRTTRGEGGRKGGKVSSSSSSNGVELTRQEIRQRTDERMRHRRLPAHINHSRKNPTRVVRHLDIQPAEQDGGEGQRGRERGQRSRTRFSRLTSPDGGTRHLQPSGT